MSKLKWEHDEEVRFVIKVVAKILITLLHDRIQESQPSRHGCFNCKCKIDFSPYSDMSFFSFVNHIIHFILLNIWNRLKNPKEGDEARMDAWISHAEVGRNCDRCIWASEEWVKVKSVELLLFGCLRLAAGARWECAFSSAWKWQLWTEAPLTSSSQGSRPKLSDTHCDFSHQGLSPSQRFLYLNLPYIDPISLMVYISLVRFNAGMGGRGVVLNLWTSHNFGGTFPQGCPKLPLEMHEGEAAGISCEGRTILSKLSPNVFPR